MACFRLVTLLPERPDRSVPRFLSRIARSTFAWAFFPYFPATISSWLPHSKIRTRGHRVASRLQPSLGGAVDIAPHPLPPRVPDVRRGR